MNIKLRDEILVQIVNQTWHLDSSSLDDDDGDNEYYSDNNSKAWHLLAHCLSCFSPSSCLHKYLLKYASDHAPSDALKYLCQRKLLRGGLIEAQLARTYPPSFLEWRASSSSSSSSSLALKLSFVDGKNRICFYTSLFFCRNFLCINKKIKTKR